MDRIPKEFKIIVYLVVLDLVFIGLFVFKIFDRFHYFSVLDTGIFISLIFLLSLLFFLFKKNIARILFLVLYSIQSAIFIILILSLVFFKQTVQIFMRLINSSKFDIYFMCCLFYLFSSVNYPSSPWRVLHDIG